MSPEPVYQPGAKCQLKMGWKNSLLTSLRPLSPPALDRLIRTCLEKKADDRWQTAHDVELQLRWIEEGGSDVGLPAPVAARRKDRPTVSWGIAALGVIAAIVFAALWITVRPAPTRLAPFARPSTSGSRSALRFTCISTRPWDRSSPARRATARGVKAIASA